MSTTYYNVGIPEAKVQQALNAVSGLLIPANSGKVLAIDNGTLVARSVTWEGTPNLQEKTATQNGDVTPDTGYDGLSKVTVDVSGGATLITKNITQNGTYNASSDNADGYSSVTVNVSGATVERVTYYGWSFSGGWLGFAVMERFDGAVFGKVEDNHDIATLTGSLISFSYPGDGANNLTITALVAVNLTIYNATTSSETNTALTGTTYQMSANEVKTISNPTYSGGLYIIAEPAS